MRMFYFAKTRPQLRYCYIH